MKLIFYSSSGWETWCLEHRPVVPEGVPILIDEDLQFEDGVDQRPTVTVNRWLRELPSAGVHSPNSWEVYARALRAWMEFLADRGVGVFEGRPRLRAALSSYAEHRFTGELAARFAPATWNLHVGVVAAFYRWAVVEGLTSAEPFSYATALRVVRDMTRRVERNLAKVRAPKAHVTVKHLESDFAELFVRALEGLRPDGTADPRFRGLEPGRNTGVAQLVLSSGLRRQEFTYLLVHEVPPLPPDPTTVPIPLPVAAAIAKGRKQRTTWVSYEALSALHRYIALERPLAEAGSSWHPDQKLGPPLVVTDADGRGGTINGRRMSWSRLGPAERLRLVDAAGGSPLLALQRDGSPFLDWATVFRRASDRIRTDFDPRFPHVNPHRLRHSFAKSTLEQLVTGYYQQAAALVTDTGTDPALALFLTMSDPLMILRDLLGHSSVATTELYLRRLDTTRVFRDAYEAVGTRAGLTRTVLDEVDDEFNDDVGVAEVAG
ncbi:integrase [Amycolatopsis thailandensis]|uniref:Integrase n=1 Tax=Amycolatopsis thailandensis TaxID=589330 RepID=A0A229SC70_9PSEU|nr:integrase [Amycolatopsis thailandensis]